MIRSLLTIEGAILMPTTTTATTYCCTIHTQKIQRGQQPRRLDQVNIWPQTSIRICVCAPFDREKKVRERERGTAMSELMLPRLRARVARSLKRRNEHNDFKTDFKV